MSRECIICAKQSHTGAAAVVNRYFGKQAVLNFDYDEMRITAGSTHCSLAFLPLCGGGCATLPSVRAPPVEASSGPGVVEPRLGSPAAVPGPAITPARVGAFFPV